MARVFLIDGTVTHSASPFLSQPVGLLSIAAVLRQQGHQVAVHDCKLDLQSLPARLVHFEPDVVGIRTLSPYLKVLEYLAAMIHRLLPGIPLVLGGPHANADPEHALRLAGADCAVLGEGELTFPELLGPLLDRTPLHGVDGVAFLDDEEFVRTTPRQPIQDLDSLPMPAWDLVPMELYFSLHHAGTAPSGRTVTIFTSRGCPFRCAFCHNIFGKRFRARGSEAVLEEIRWLHRTYGIEEFEIHDDAFNTDLQRLDRICHGLQQDNQNILLAFPNGLRGDRLPREALIDLRLAGTHHIALSPETASPRLQKMLGKNMQLERLERAARDCDDLGILTVGYFMLGFPTETEDEMQATIDWACASALHTASFFNVIAFPGTRLHAMAVAEGNPPDQWQNSKYFEGDVNLSRIPDERFRQLWHGAYRRFYLHPGRLRRIWRATPNKGLLFRNGLHVATRFFNR